MTQPQPLYTYCAICARSALGLAARESQAFTPGSTQPRFMPVSMGPVRRRDDGSWDVPVARVVSGGDSVCMFHLAIPQAVNVE
jgi:hypothetical protein